MRLRLDEFGLRLRLRDRQAIFPETFEMHRDRITDILVEFTKCRGGGNTSRQVRNVRGIIALRSLDNYKVFQMISLRTELGT